MLKFSPAVFAVGDCYQIMVPVTDPSLFWIEVGDRCFYDEQNGIMRSLCTTHRVTVPMELLDSAREYTVCERTVIDRKPYFPESADTERTVFDFCPLPEGDIRLYHVADAHNRVESPVAAAEQFGKIDLLVMNGDIPNHSGDIACFDTVYEIAERLTGGRIPIVFARGNHDLRGYYAEQMGEHIPNLRGNTYYSFRLRSVWGLVLDCGEDKCDSHAEYGLTVACHAFRERQTEYIREIISRAEAEYAAAGVRHRLIVSHNPFTYLQEPPFDIEREIYAQWASLIRENIKPELMLCGHLHETFVSEPGGDRDHLGQPCTLVSGSSIGESSHTGCGIVLRENGEAEIGFYCGEAEE